MKVKKKKANKKNKAQLKLSTTGWNTSNEDEVILRKIRAEQEKFKIFSNEQDHVYYGTFSVRPINKDTPYIVEIRSLNETCNSCDCFDNRINGLGTCKHIEAVLSFLKKKGVRKYKKAIVDANPRVDIYLDTAGEPRVRVIKQFHMAKPLQSLVEAYFS